MDFTQLRMELLRAMRGKRSQIQISNRMGYQYNCVSRWELGQNAISWVEFVNFARACKIEISKSLKRQVNFQDDPEDYSKLIKQLCGFRDINVIAGITGKTRHVVTNWLKKRTCPTLEMVLILLHEQQFILSEFILGLVSEDLVPSIGPIVEEKRIARETVYRNPIVSGVIAGLQLQGYLDLEKHVPGWIAKKTGISLADENRILEELVSIGVLKFFGKKYVPASVQIDTHGNIKGVVAIRKYWGGRFFSFLDQLKEAPQKTKSGYFIFAANEAVEKEVYDAYLEFLLKVRTLISKDHSENTTIKIVNLEIMDLPEMAEMGSNENRKLK